MGSTPRCMSDVDADSSHSPLVRRGHWYSICETVLAIRRTSVTASWHRPSKAACPTLGRNPGTLTGLVHGPLACLTDRSDDVTINNHGDVVVECVRRGGGHVHRTGHILLLHHSE